ncbi:class I adenylate-forming enzyme family protein [Pseudobutyrivibrio ruminis]|uniref:class I adenylate-forming enzyme family protein n=1 Tax=Pseudobutyrivibrio ruminis TaxID=46206 RepID=UPI0004253901|nr:AMP-binding protein [Pseudobutyrivibrio ruminis]
MYDFFENIKSYQNRIAYRYFREDTVHEVTYTQYYNNILECLANLQERFGDIEGKHVAIKGNNCYEYIVILAALILGKAVVVPVNIRESDEVIEEILADADTDYVISQNSFKDYCSFKNDESGNHSFDLSDENRLVMIIYTSGTTGKPKGVMLTLKNLFGRKRNILPKEYAEDEAKDDLLITYLVFPLYHAAGLCSWLSWCNRGCMTYINEDIGNMLNELQEIKIDFAFVSPATMKLWKKRLKRGGALKLGCVKSVGTTGAPMDREIIDFFVENGINYCQFYGMTETFGDVTYNSNVTDKVASVGKLTNDAVLKIIDDEICVSSWNCMKGYYNNPSETVNTIIDGMIHTGDLGYIDEDGYVYITGRKKNLIILSGGENVSPEELENLLYKNQAVKECKVFERDDKIVAAVFAKESDEEVIRQYVSDLNKGLPIFKKIHVVEFQNKEFEKTASGKIRR